MVTRDDVAKLANVSPTVVSYVLNGSNYVSKEKKEAVLQAVQELNYIPNQTARYLKMKQTRQIAVLCGDRMNEMFNALFQKMEKLAYQKGYLLFQVTVIRGENNFATDEFINSMISRHFDAVFVANSSLTEEQLNQLISHDIAVLLLLTREYRGLDKRIACIMPDYKKAVKTLVEDLINKGHRRIAFVPNIHYPAILGDGNYRLNGYMEALLENSISVNPQYIITNNDTLEQTIELVRNLYEEKSLQEAPTAICVDEAILAGRIILQAAEDGYSVPEDFSVVASSDSMIANMISPSITATGFDLSSFAQEAIDMIMASLNGDILPINIVEMKMFERQSTGEARSV